MMHQSIFPSLLALLVLVCPAFADDGSRPSLSLPLNCVIGTDCWVQNLVDFDSSNGIRDPYCGSASFNKHKGTDFRVRTTKDLSKEIPVLSMADGTVVALRNSMAEKLVESDADLKFVENKECGNGVFIRHEGGWSSQICHLAKGSVRPKKGEKVKRGDVIGLMGLSGHTTFPHVHVTVRKGKTVIDPMTGLAQSDACSPNAGLTEKSLWTQEVRARMPLQFTAILETGYSSSRPSTSRLLKGKSGPVLADGPLIFYAKFINVRKGDRIDLTVKGPNGVFATSRGKPLDRAKATWTQYTGKKGAVPAGSAYSGSVTLFRNGKPLLKRDNIKISF